MKKITLVSCCREKLSRMAPPRELYRSPLFRKSAAWAEKQGDEWFVLSAKHGILKPDAPIMPYDMTMRGMSPYEKQYWANAVEGQLNALALFWGVDQLEITLLAGADYAIFAPLADWCTVNQPLQKMQIGQRLQWLNAQMEGYSNRQISDELGLPLLTVAKIATQHRKLYGEGRAKETT